MNLMCEWILKGASKKLEMAQFEHFELKLYYVSYLLVSKPVVPEYYSIDLIPEDV